jgi:putative transposase
MTAHQLGVTRACGLAGISRSLYRYESKRADDTELTERLTELAGKKRRYGYRRLHVLLCREGWHLNRKRTYRVYRAAGLMVRRHKRKRIAGIERQDKVIAQAPNQSWSMDFVSDGFVDGRRLRCLNIVDDFTKECLAIEVDTSLPGRRVVNVLERLAERRGLPRSVR